MERLDKLKFRNFRRRFYLVDFFLDVGEGSEMIIKFGNLRDGVGLLKSIGLYLNGNDDEEIEKLVFQIKKENQ